MASAVASSAIANPLDSSQIIPSQLTRDDVAEVGARDTPRHSNVNDEAPLPPYAPSAPTLDFASSPYLPSLPSSSGGEESGSDSSGRGGGGGGSGSAKSSNRRREEEDAPLTTRDSRLRSRRGKDGGSVSSSSSSRRSVRRKDVIRPIAASEQGPVATPVATRKEEVEEAGLITPGDDSENSPTSVAHIDHDDMKSSALLPPYSQHPLILITTPLETPETPRQYRRQQLQQEEEAGGCEPRNNNSNNTPRNSSTTDLDNNNNDNDNNNNDNDNGNNNDSTALVLHSSSERPRENRRSVSCLMICNRQPRGMDPDECIRDRALLHRDGDGDDDGPPEDPPGESSNDGPAVRSDLVPHVRGNGSGNGRLVSRRKGVVQWVDPKTLNDEGEIDRSVLRRYERMTSSSATHGGYDANRGTDPPSDRTSPSITESLFRNSRMRIATVSSGYRKADFFVREDLDTRIYFHQLEDAVGYMAKRGYVKMRSEEEREWKDLLGRAHGVVKVGPKKEKQRYRKGKLILVLKKTISDHKDETSLRKKRKSSRRSSRKKSSSSPLLLENGPSSASSSSQTSRSDSSYTTAVTSSSRSTANTRDTDRTSLGKSIRGEYKSYSEKFLAEQEQDKRRYMLAIVEGRPLPDAYPSDTVGGRLLLLAEDGPANRNRRGGPVDPEEDYRSRSRASASGGTAADYSATDGGSAAEYADRTSEFKRSARTVGSNRKGVYGGGVRYFTPDNHDAPSEVSEEEEEEDYTEEEYFEEEETYDEENTYSLRSDNEEGIDCDGSDMDSMFPEEEEAYDYKGNAGVESVTSETPSERRSSGRGGSGGRGSSRRDSSPKQGYKSTKNRRGTKERFDAPEMLAISDDSASTNS